MAELKDFRELSESLHGLFDKLKKENDGLLEEVEKHGKAQALTEEKVDKINSMLQEKEEAWGKKYDELQRQYEALEAASKRPRTDADPKDGKSLAMKAWGKVLRCKAEEITPEERTALDKDGPTPEMKTYLSETSGSGLEWAPVEFVNELFKDVTEFDPIRRIARVFRTSRAKIQIPTHTSAWTTDADFLAEGGTNPTVTQATSAVVTVEPHRIGTLFSATREAIMDVAFDLEAMIRQDAADRIAAHEGNQFVLGGGTEAPTGFLANVGTAVACSAAPTADELIDLYYGIKTPYAENGTFVGRRSTISYLRKLKDGASQYVWDFSPPGGIVGPSPATVLGRPILESPAVPAIAATGDVRSLAFGDFRRGYAICDQGSFAMGVDPYTTMSTNTVNYHGVAYTSGAILKAEALAAWDGPT